MAALPIIGGALCSTPQSLVEPTTRVPCTNALKFVWRRYCCLTNWKKLLNSNISPTCAHIMVNFGLLAAEIGWRVWGTPATFNGFRVLAALCAVYTSRSSQRSVARPIAATIATCKHTCDRRAISRRDHRVVII